MATATKAAPARRVPAKKAAASAAPKAQAKAKDEPPGDSDAEAGDEDKTLLDKAAAALAGVGISLADVIGELIPTEAAEGDLVRRAKRPTLSAVRRSPICVVMIEWDKAFSEDLDKPVDRDCEGFDDLDKAIAYYKTNVSFARTDVREFDMGSHLVVLFHDTKDFSDRRFETFSSDPAVVKAITERMEANDLGFVFSGKGSALVTSDKAPGTKSGAKKATPKVTPKKASAAAAAVRSDGATGKAASLNDRLSANRERRAAAEAAKSGAPTSAPKKKASAASPKNKGAATTA